MSSSYYEGSKWEAHFPPQKMIFPYLCSLSAPLLLHCNLTPPTPSEGSMVAIISSKSSYLSVPALNVFEKRREEEREGGRKGGETLWGKWRLEWGQGMAFITYGKEKKEAVAKKLRESEEKTLRKQKEGKNERGTDWMRRSASHLPPDLSQPIFPLPFIPPLHPLQAESVMSASPAQNGRVWRLLTLHATGFSFIPYNSSRGGRGRYQPYQEATEEQ